MSIDVAAEQLHSTYKHELETVRRLNKWQQLNQMKILVLL